MGSGVRLRITGSIALVLVICYAIFSLVMLVSVDGTLWQDTLVLRGVDPTDADQLLAAFEDPAFRPEGAARRFHGHYLWYYLRPAAMALLAIAAAVSLARRSLTSANWLRTIAWVMPASSIALFTLVPSGSASARMGQMGGSVLGGLLWGALAFVHERRVIRRAEANPGDAEAASEWWRRVGRPSVLWGGGLAILLTGGLMQWGRQHYEAPSSMAEWTDQRRLSFIANCTKAASAQPGVTEAWAREYCKCFQGEIEKRYEYADFLANELQYTRELTADPWELSADNVVLLCSTLAAARTEGKVEPPPINQNPQNPMVDQSTDEEFVSEKHHFSIRRPAGWANVEMDGQLQWTVASNNGEGPDSCFVKVSEDWSFGVMGNETFIEEGVRNKQERVDMLKVLFDSPVINQLDRYTLGGQDALRVVYTGEADGVRLTNYVLQTVRGAKLYTFGASTLSEDFVNRYLLFQRVENAFRFTK